MVVLGSGRRPPYRPQFGGLVAMFRIRLAAMSAALIGSSALAAPAQAQQPGPPPFATTKVSDNVYIFRYGCAGKTAGTLARGWGLGARPSDTTPSTR